MCIRDRSSTAELRQLYRQVHRTGRQRTYTADYLDRPSFRVPHQRRKGFNCYTRVRKKDRKVPPHFPIPVSYTHLFCVIMGGGIGSRFWPFSRKTLPKQFLDFFGTGRSLLQQMCIRDSSCSLQVQIRRLPVAAYGNREFLALKVHIKSV